MINLQRAQRQTDFWKIQNPDNLGPGAHDKQNASQFNHKRDAPAPFSTTNERELTKELNSHPGPGQYKQKQQKVVPKVQDKMNNAFSTQIARFCPTQPGSGMVKGPSWIDNPEPGTHYKPIKWNELKDQDKTLLKYTQKMNKGLTVTP